MTLRAHLSVNLLCNIMFLRVILKIATQPPSLQNLLQSYCFFIYVAKNSNIYFVVSL